MKKTFDKRNFLFLMGQLFIMALAVVTGGGVTIAAQVGPGSPMSQGAAVDAGNTELNGATTYGDGSTEPGYNGVEVTHVPEAQVTNPAGVEGSAIDGTMAFPEQSVTTGQNAAPETYETAYDKLLTKVRPVRTPIDTISRRVARTKNPKNMEFRYGTIDYLPFETTLGTAYTAAQSPSENEIVTIRPTKPAIFNRRDVIIVQGVPGYDTDGTTEKGDLLLWVVDRHGNYSIDVMAINGKKVSSTMNTVPGIAKDTKLIRAAKACAELDSQAPGYSIFPSTDLQYCQKFMAQVEQSTIDALTAKRFDIGLNDQEEATIADMKMTMELAFLFGVRGKLLDPETRRYAWFTGGIWDIPEKDIYLTASSEIADMVDVTRTLFTGPAAGRSNKRLVVCGSSLLAFIEKMFIGNYTYIHKVKKWDLEFTEVTTNFGDLMFILGEAFDIANHSSDGIILDPDYLERFTLEKFGSKNLDLDAQGVRDSKARVLREISALVLKSPKNHARLHLVNSVPQGGSSDYSDGV